MKNKTAYIIMAAALVMIFVGVLLHQQTDVLTKAARICLECIGIG